MTRPLGVGPVPGRINGIVSSDALSGPCLLTSVELFSMLPLDRKDMRNGNSPSDPRGKPAFLASHQAVSQRRVGHAGKGSYAWPISAHVATPGGGRSIANCRQVRGLQVNSRPLPLTAGSVSTQRCSVNKQKHCFLLKEVFKYLFHLELLTAIPATHDCSCWF